MCAPPRHVIDTTGYRRGSPIVVLGDPNTARLPHYMRLDVGVRTEWEKRWFGRDVTLIPYLQILNVLGTENVTAGNPRFSFEDDGQGELEYLPALPFLPTFGIEWTF